MADQQDRLTLGVAEAAVALGISERHLRQMIADGRFPVVRLGRRVVVIRSALERWLAGQGAAVDVVA